MPMPATPHEWMLRFRDRITAERVPLSGTLELTSRCNLKCVHCYLGSQEEQWRKRSQELPTERLLELVDEIVDAGCLYLLITGGDPMVHRDFARIYRHACERGLMVTVFCDGILVDERILALFRELPPRTVEISLYGATRETYEAVTRVKGSFARAVRGIERLLENGTRLGLKTVLMTVNRHELAAMREMARRWEVPFRVDNAIFPCLPVEDDSPMDLRVAPREAVELETRADPERLDQWLEYVDARRGQRYGDGLYRCGAGVNSFHLDPYGYAQPCLMTTQYRHSLEGRSFRSLWERELVQLRSRRPGADYPCNDCEMHLVCGGCPAFNFQENGREDVRSEYVCETTRERWQAIELHRTRPRGAAAAATPGEGS